MPLLRGLLLLLLASPSVRGAEAWLVRLVDAGGRPVPDAVVSIFPLDQPPPAPPNAAPRAEIVQEQGEFRPYVLPVRVGTRVAFPNRDQVQHHVYSVSPARRFEIPLSGGDVTHDEVFDRPGVVSVGCNIHDWMLSYIVVLDTPWFARSGEDGQAALTLDGAAPGRYRLEIWHPRLQRPLTEEWTWTGGAPPPVDRTLTLRPDRRVRRALESRSDGYR